MVRVNLMEEASSFEIIIDAIGKKIAREKNTEINCHCREHFSIMHLTMGIE